MGIAPNSDPVYVSSITIVATAHKIDSANVAVDGKKFNAASRVFSSELLGVNLPEADQIKNGVYTVSRWGGNTMTTYSFDYDAENHAADWFFESLPHGTGQNLPDGSTANDWIGQTKAGNARALLTIPTIGWSMIDRQKRCAFSVQKYGAQQKTDGDCGNGMKPDGTTKVTGNDPTDAYKKVGPEYAVKWLDHLNTKWGADWIKNSLFALDNEPEYWPSTHRDIHPNPMTYDELWENTKTYASLIKSKYPDAKIAGPDVSNFCYMMYMPDGGCKPTNEFYSHGNISFYEWHIMQIADYYKKTGVKLLDVWDYHCYPDGVYASPRDTLKAVITMRSVRELYDLTYWSAGWHGKQMAILPRALEAIKKHAPWMKTSCTEFNWNLGQDGDDDVLAAVANTEALAIFAREGLDIATRWMTPKTGSIAEYAYRMFTGNDGSHALKGAKVLDVANPDLEAYTAYGFQTSAYTWVLLFNKQPLDALSATVSLANVAATGPASVFVLDASHKATKTQTVAISGSKVTVSLPVQSAVLVEIPTAGTAQSSSAHSTHSTPSTPATPSSHSAPVHHDSDSFFPGSASLSAASAALMGAVAVARAL
eukprot:m51a1_g13564 hypothetical protein (594) ;mRNA; f:34-1904